MTDVPGPGLLFGLMLVAAITGGYAARWIHIPRVVGFLVGGVALRQILVVLLTSTDGGDSQLQALQQADAPLQAVKDLALGLILFTIGGVFERSHLKTVGARVLRISLAEIATVILFVGVGCALVALVTRPSGEMRDAFVLVFLLTMAGIATAPAATLFVLNEYDAKGPITDTILSVTGINNIVCIVLFYLTFFVLASIGMIESTGQLTDNVWLALASIVGGSVALGVVCGILLSVCYIRLPLAETTLIFFAIFILLGAGESWMLSHFGFCYNFLLTALVIGGLFANVAVDSRKLTEAIRTIGSPIFAGFFVMAGYDLHLADLRHIGWLGVMYLLARGAAKIIGVRLGTRWAKFPPRADWGLGGALLCQAAVVIGLASFVSDNWNSPLAAQFTTIILGSVVVFELVGPLLIKRCVVQAGEVKAITLTRRGTPTTEGGSAVRLTLEAMSRLFGFGRGGSSDEPTTLKARDVMRTNVQFLRADCTLDEVLHFIERSTYSHFTVVDEDGLYAGVIHFADVHDVIYDPSLHDLVTAVDLADPESTTVTLDISLHDLFAVFTRDNVGVLPVIATEDEQRIVGIVEQRDVLRAMTRGKRTA